MNISSYISIGIAFFSLLFSIIYNTTNIKKARDKETQELINAIKEESIEKGENRFLFKEMNRNLERIVEDNKIMNERIYNLTERVATLEHNQQNIQNITKQLPLIENKAERAHQRIDLIEHDLGKDKK